MKKNKKIGIMHYVKKYKFKFLIYVSFLVLFNLTNIYTVIEMANFISYITVLDYSNAITSLILFSCAGIGGRLVYFISNMVFVRTKADMQYDIQIDLTRQFFKIKTQTFTNVKSGEFINRVSYDPENAIDQVDQIFEQFASIFSFGFTTLYVLFANLYIGLIIAGFMVILIAIEFLKVKVNKKYRTLEKAQKDKIVGITNEIVKSERDIKSLNLEENLDKDVKTYCNDYRKINKKRGSFVIVFWDLRHLIITIMLLVVSFVSIILLKDGKMAIATFLYVIMNRDSISSVVWCAGNVSKQISEAKICMKRMFEILNPEKYPIESFGDKVLDNCIGEIEFKDVEFSYESKDAETGEITLNKVLDIVNFKVMPNTTVAFAGKSGSGKSTILNLMSKLTECQNGEISIDGENIKNISREFLRDNISLVNQFPYIFDNTIRNNLLMVKQNATEEELIKACRDASIWEFVASLPKGLDTQVGEGGISLSGGQRQRLAIARALLRKTKIILFDESTSALDNFAQADIKKSIDALSKDSTVVIVAHRLSTIKNCDKIYFIEDGIINGEGTFDELFENNEQFKNMFLVENI